MLKPLFNSSITSSHWDASLILSNCVAKNYLIGFLPRFFYLSINLLLSCFSVGNLLLWSPSERKEGAVGLRHCGGSIAWGQPQHVFRQQQRRLILRCHSDVQRKIVLVPQVHAGCKVMPFIKLDARWMLQLVVCYLRRLNLATDGPLFLLSCLWLIASRQNSLKQ